MSKKKQNPAESQKHDRILKTAQKLFVAHGYGEVSMDALAEAVPVSKRTLYNHFRDKKSLFTAVMQSRCRFVADSLKEILIAPEQDARETLIACAQQFLEVVLHPQAVDIYRTAITQVQHFPQLGELFYESGPKRSMKIMAEYLEALDKRGLMDVPNPMRAAGVFFSMLVGRMQMRMLLGVDKKIPRKEVESHIAYVVDVFLRGNQPLTARRAAKRR